MNMLVTTTRPLTLATILMKWQVGKLILYVFPLSVSPGQQCKFYPFVNLWLCVDAVSMFTCVSVVLSKSGDLLTLAIVICNRIYSFVRQCNFHSVIVETGFLKPQP